MLKENGYEIELRSMVTMYIAFVFLCFPQNPNGFVNNFRHLRRQSRGVEDPIAHVGRVHDTRDD
jgi:hypothetical protein